MKMEYALLAFVSTHAAMAAQRQLRERIAFTVMPTLRAITHSCGISLRLAPADVPAARGLLQAAGLGEAQVRYFAVYPAERCAPFPFADDAHGPDH